MDKRTIQIVRASWIGIIGNAVLAFFKIFFGIISGSYAVIGDGIDSASDIATYIVTLVTAKIMNRPPNKIYPYGYKRAETVATNIVSFVIMFVGLELLVSSIGEIFNKEPHEIPSVVAIYVTIGSIIGKFILSVWQTKLGNKLKSSMILANAKNMKNDILISFSVLIGLLFTYIFELPMIDVILGILVSLWIIWIALSLFFKTNRELMDGLKNDEIYSKIIKSAEKIRGVYNPHRIRIRQHSNMYVIGLDVEVSPNITVKDAHKLCKKIEKNIRENVENIYDIMIHTEPRGNEENERFGVSKNVLSNSGRSKDALRKI